ncbi:MAG: cysteine desulfurase family protein [Fimbriimonadaceae bacterium]
MAPKRIYLDYAATAPPLPEASAAMAKWLRAENFGNPSSLHAEGRAAKAAIDVAREQVSGAFGCAFGEVTFTSGGTEAANLALVGAALAGATGHRTRVLASATEHHAVLETEPVLGAVGVSLERVAVDRWGRVRLDHLDDLLADDVLLVSVMFAHNELGTWQPVAEVGALAARYGALFHCDAVQAFGIAGPTGAPWNVASLGADLVSVSAHKLGGPKGVGALYVKAGTRLEPTIRGGGQEREMRAGTENVAAIAGFGAVAHEPAASVKRYTARTAFAAELVGLELTIAPDIATHPGILHCRARGISAETILIRLDRAGVGASSGAACSSGSLEPSHVLTACGFSPEEAKEGLRFSFGEATSVEDAVTAAHLLNEIVQDVRSTRAR